MKHGIHASLLPLACSISTLKADPKNARLHDERNIDAVEKSYDKHGQRKPIVVQKRRTPRMCEQCGGTGRLSVPMDGFNPSGSTPCLKCEGSGDLLEFIVRAGNGQMMAAKRLGWTHIAAVIVEENDKDAIAFAIRDNRTAELAEWDWKVIAEEMATFETGTGESFTELGWNEAELVPLRQTDWFLAATGQLEPRPRRALGDRDPADVAGAMAAAAGDGEQGLLGHRLAAADLDERVDDRLQRAPLLRIGDDLLEVPDLHFAGEREQPRLLPTRHHRPAPVDAYHRLLLGGSPGRWSRPRAAR